MDRPKTSRPVRPPLSQSVHSKPSKPSTSRRKTEPEDESDDRIVLMVVPPDGGWGWVVMIAAFCCNAITDGTIYTFGLFIGELQKEFHTTRTAVSLTGSIVVGLCFLSGPFVSALVNRYGFRIICICGAILTSASFILASLCASLQSLYVTYGVMGGIGMGVIYVPVIVVVGHYFERWRAIATGISVCGSGIGTMALPPLINLMLNNFTWRTTFCIMAGVIAFICVCGLTFRPVPPYYVVSSETNLQYDISRAGSVEVFSSEADDPLNALRKNPNFPTVASVKTKSNFSLLPATHYSVVSLAPSQASRRYVIAPVGSLSAVASRVTVPKNIREEEEEEHIIRKNCCSRCCSRMRKCCRRRRVESTYVHRPFYRDDIFFQGSLATLSEYSRAKVPTQKSAVNYHMSVTRVASTRDLANEGHLCSDAVKRVLVTMLDCTILQSFAFDLLAVSGFFTMLGMYVPYTYISARAVEAGISSDKAYWLVSAMGLANTLGRIFSGLVSTIPHVPAIFVSIVSLMTGGLATIGSNYCMKEWCQYAYGVTYGLTLACIASLVPIIIVDLLGLEKLTSGFGIVLLFQGCGAIMGSPLAGFLRERTGSYYMSFLACGTFIMVSAILLLPVKCISKWEKQHKTKRNTRR